MKNALLFSAVLSLIVLTGCGQNVDTIKADFAKKVNTNAEQEFSGYTFLFSKEERDKAQAFLVANELPPRTERDHKGAILPLKKVNFKGDSYEKVFELHKAYSERLAEINKKAVISVERENARLMALLDNNKKELLERESIMSEFKAMFAIEQAAFDAARTKVDIIKKRTKDREEAYLAELKEEVVAHSLPIKANFYSRPSSYYQHFDKKACENAEQSKIKYLADKDDGCIYIKLSEEHAVLEPVLRNYGVDFKNMQKEFYEALDMIDETNASLQKARIIAENKTGIEEDDKLKIQIQDNKTVIEKIENTISRDNNIEKVVERLIDLDNSARKLRSDFSAAVRTYNKQVEIEAMNRVDFDVREFNDETALPQVNDGDRGMVFYVFTNANNIQTVFVSKLTSKERNKSYGDLFSNARSNKFEFNIESKRDLVKAALLI